MRGDCSAEAEEQRGRQQLHVCPMKKIWEEMSTISVGLALVSYICLFYI